jgi:hypothetical protein
MELNKSDQLKLRTKEFAHRCVKLDESLSERRRVEPLLKESEELTAIFFSSRKTARIKR